MDSNSEQIPPLRHPKPEKKTVPKKWAWHYFGLKKAEWKPSKPSESYSYSLQLAQQLKNFKAKHPEDEQEWLRAFYNRYTDRFTKDNEKIWATAAIFIPLSLAGLSYFTNVSCLRTLLIGLGSIKLMEFWVNVAENHRAFQQKSQVVATTIERHIGLNFGDFDIEDNEDSGKTVKLLDVIKLDSHAEIRHNVQLARWKMLYAVRIIWLIAFLGSCAKAIIKTNDLLQARALAAATRPTKSVITMPNTTTIKTTTTSKGSGSTTSAIVDLFL